MRIAGSVIEGRILSLQSKKYHSLLYFLLFTSALFFGCATTEDVGRLQWDINELRSEVGKIKQRYQEIEAQLPKEAERLSELRSEVGKIKERYQEIEAQLPKEAERLSEKLKEVEEGQRATGKAVSDLIMKVQTMSKDVQSLIGRFDEARYSSERNLKELTAKKDALIAQLKEVEISVRELKERLARMESELTPQRPKLAEEPARSERTLAEEEPKKEEKPPKPPIVDVYMEAYNTYKAGKFKEAREKFKDILKDYPENEYSDNARFWIAETYYKEKAYEDAILSYEELLRKNPQSNKAPEALLKQGLAFYAIKEDEFGRLTLEKLIKKFPNSEEARLARKKIGEPQTPKKKK